VVKRRSVLVGAAIAISLAGCSLLIGDLSDRAETPGAADPDGGDSSLGPDSPTPGTDGSPGTDSGGDAAEGGIVHGCTYRGEKRGVPSTVYVDGDAGLSDFDVSCDGVVYANVHGGVFSCPQDPKKLALDGKDILVLSTSTTDLKRIAPGGAVTPVYSWPGRDFFSLHAHGGRAVVNSHAGSPRTKTDAVQIDGGGYVNLLTHPTDNFGLIFSCNGDTFYEAGQTNASPEAITMHDIRDGGTSVFTSSKLGAMFRLAASRTFVVWLYNGNSLAACKVPCTTPTQVTINGAELEKGSFFYADDELFYFRGSGGSGGLFACTVAEMLSGNCTAIALSIAFPEISELRSDRDYVYWLATDGTTIGRIAK
jgi:hypothetical protein